MKQARNAKKTSGEVLREKGLGRRIPGGSAESEAGPYSNGFLDELVAKKIISMSIHFVCLVGAARSARPSTCFLS